MTKTDALKLARDILSNDAVFFQEEGMNISCDQCMKVIAAIDAALAEPEAPVAYQYRHKKHAPHWGPAVMSKQALLICEGYEERGLIATPSAQEQA